MKLQDSEQAIKDLKRVLRDCQKSLRDQEQAGLALAKENSDLREIIAQRESEV